MRYESHAWIRYQLFSRVMTDEEWEVIEEALKVPDSIGLDISCQLQIALSDTIRLFFAYKDHLDPARMSKINKELIELGEACQKLQQVLEDMSLATKHTLLIDQESLLEIENSLRFLYRSTGLVQPLYFNASGETVWDPETEYWKRDENAPARSTLVSDDGKGRKRSDSLIFLIQELSRIYGHATGEEIKVPSNEKTKEYPGSILQFVWEILVALDEKYHSVPALAKLIKRVHQGDQ